MSLSDAVRIAGPIPDGDTAQAAKKAYAERLSRALAEEIAAGMREIGFPTAKPQRGEPGEKEFLGGLGTKKVDVSYSDERQGLIQAVTVKTICFPPFGKNLKNRFGDLCTESITLHMRFPYATVCMFFAFPDIADADQSERRKVSTFRRAMKLLATVGGRSGYTDAGEKFESVALMLFEPVRKGSGRCGFKLFNAATGREMTEADYFDHLRELHDLRNPHAPIQGDEELD